MHREALLIIDDDPDFRELIRFGVSNEGLDLLDAPDCVQGIALLRKTRERVAIVLVDYWMPNMEPACCCAKVVELVRPDTRVILVTAAVDARARAVELGLREWLSKPFEIALLRRIIRETCRRPAAVGEPADRERPPSPRGPR